MGKSTIGGMLALLLAVPAQAAVASAAAPQKLGEGYRAMALTLDGDQTAFLAPGDRIDIMSTFKAEAGEAKGKVTATLLQNVRVLAINPSTGTPGHGVLLLQVNANEAQYLALAIDDGHGLRVIKRNADDKAMKPMEMASMRKLFR